MNETTITKQIMSNWQRQHSDLWFWKIPDYTRPGYGYSNDRAVDVVICCDGAFVGMEWKLKKDNRAFPLKRIRDGQIKTLCDIEIAGGTGFLMIAVYLSPHDKCVYAIPIKQWNKEAKEVHETGRKSIRIEEVFSYYRIEPRRIGTYVHWNFKLVEEVIDAAKHR